MSAIRQIMPNYTSEDYERWEGRWEIINGLAVDMSPMPSPRHQNIAGKVFRILDEAIENNGCQHCKVYQPIDYRIDDHTIVNPDISIVCDPINGQYLEFPPVLVVEIISPSTAFKDRNTKYDLYQKEGIKYYIIIDPIDDTIEVFTLGEDGLYFKSDSKVFKFGDDCVFEVDLSVCLR